MFKPLLDYTKLPKFCAKLFVCQNSQLFGVFFGFVCGKKNLNGWSEKLETWHVKTLDCVWKTVRKNIPLAAVHCEFDILNMYTNISYIFYTHETFIKKNGAYVCTHAIEFTGLQ